LKFYVLKNKEKRLQHKLTTFSFYTFNRKSSPAFISKRLLLESVYVLKQRENDYTVGLNPIFAVNKLLPYHLTKTPHFCLNFNSKKNVWQQLFILNFLIEKKLCQLYLKKRPA
jgi:hypothetical protein